MIRPRITFTFLACFFAPLAVGAQSTFFIDTAAVEAAEVLALRIPSTAAQAASNIAVLEATALQNGHSPDLQDALNSVPGILMETRGTGGSRRLQMRSSGLRSPFGVRNVLMLMDGFVLTNASGNSHGIVDPQWLDRLKWSKVPSVRYTEMLEVRSSVRPPALQQLRMPPVGGGLHSPGRCQ